MWYTNRDGRIAQLVRAFASHARGLGFESQCVHHLRSLFRLYFYFSSLSIKFTKSLDKIPIIVYDKIIIK